MPKQYNIDQINLLESQKALNRNLRKGDYIFLGKKETIAIEKLLRANNIAFTSCLQMSLPENRALKLRDP